jgi:N-methylhydantoinase B
MAADDGEYRRIGIRLREAASSASLGPTKCSVATTNLADRLVNVVQRAFGTLGAEVGTAAASGSSLPPSCGVVSGLDPRADGAAFINVVILGAGGGPGTPARSGPAAASISSCRLQRAECRFWLGWPGSEVRAFCVRGRLAA